MARYLLAENRVKMLMQDGSLANAALIKHAGVWVEREGLWVGASTGVDTQYVIAIGVVQLDGVVVPVSNNGPGFPHVTTFYQNLNPQSEGFLGKVNWSNYTYYERHRRLQYDVNPDPVSWLSGIAGGAFVRLGGDVYNVLAFDNRGSNWYFVKFFDNDVANAADYNYWIPVSDPISFPSSPTIGSPTMSYAGGNLFYVCFSGGRYLLYDAGNNVVVHKDRWIDDFRVGMAYKTSATVYARDLGVFITLAWDAVDACYLLVYANEGDPTQVSAPTATPSLKVLGASGLAVFVTGAQGDSVENAVVDWSLTGAGSLALSQTVTDEDGRTENTYIGPSSAAPDVTVSVSTEEYY